MEREMIELTLRSVRPVAPRETANFSARILTAFVIGFAGILSLLPFLAYFRS